MVKNLKFESFSFLQKSQISWFCQILLFTGLGWSKTSNFETDFQHDSNILIFESPTGPGWSKISNLTEIFNMIPWHDSNILILPNFIVCMTSWPKILKIGPSFKCDSNILILPNFIIHRTGVVKKLKIWAKFLKATQISWFCHILWFLD